jgi:hypothetical protein
MLSASPITNQPVGKTFSFAISVLGAGAVLQLVLIGWAFVNRARTGVPPSVVAQVVPSTTLEHIPTTPPQTTTLDISSNPLNEPKQSFTTTPDSSVPSRPTPVPNRPSISEPTNRFDELVLQGKQLRERGDMSTAITKFREAATIDAKSPVPLTELAMTYDKMGMAEKAAENWRKIYEMGEGAGIAYQAAKAKLEATQANTLREVVKPAAPAPEAAPVDNSTAIDGIAAGATLGLLQITPEEQRDDNSAKHFLLHIPIKARPKAHIDVKDLVIHVLFYDIVDGQNVVQTSANVQSRWATPPADWADTDTEELAVEYQLPKPEPRAAKRENRKYFGYIVRIYYKQQLQAATAEPERLAQQYPPPPTLPKENEK